MEAEPNNLSKINEEPVENHEANESDEMSQDGMDSDSAGEDM
jgi:hypothetical protein